MFLEKVLLRSIKNNNPSLVTLALLARITNASANSCTECTFGESVLSPSPTERKLCIYAKRRKIKARVFFPLFFLFCLFFPFFHFFCNAYYVARVIYIHAFSSDYSSAREGVSAVLIARRKKSA